MRIAILSRSLPGHSAGGLESYAWQMARGLKSREHEVHLITAQGLDDSWTNYAESILATPIEQMPTTDHRRVNHSWGQALAEKGRHWDRLRGADVVISNSNALYGLATLPGFRVPIVTVMHGNILSALAWPSQSKPYAAQRLRSLASMGRGYLSRAEYRLFRESHMVCLSRYDATRSRIAYRMAENQVHVIPPPIPVFEGHENAVRRDVLAAGRLARGKGFDVLIEAWRRAGLDTAAGDRLLIVGSGVEREALERMAPKNTAFLGVFDQMKLRQYMSNAKAVVVPSQYPESFGLVAAEAMAAGALVISSDVGALPEVVGTGGIVVPASSRSLSKALAWALDDHNRCEAELLRGKALELAKTRYSFDSVWPKLEKVLTVAVQGAARSGTTWSAS